MSQLTKSLRDKLYQYFLTRGGMSDYTRGWMKGDCPWCGKHKFGIHLGDDRSNCFYCGPKSKPLFIVSHIENLKGYRATLDFLNVFEGYEYFYKEIETTIPEQIELPDGFHLLDDDSSIGEKARKYLSGRGLNVEELIGKGFGYCTKGKYMGYIIMPFYHNNKLIYFHARRLFGGGPKFNNPKKDEVGIGKTMALYNCDSLYMYESIYMVESVINAETLGPDALASGGKDWSQYQLSMILRSPVKSVTLILDPDAINKSIEYALYLFGHKSVRIIQLPEKQDVNSYGLDNTMAIVDKTAFLSYKQLMKLNNERPKYTY